MHVRSRVLVIAGALVLAALTPHVLDDGSALRGGESAVLAAGSGDTGPADTDAVPEGQFDERLFEHVSEEVEERAPERPRKPRGDRGACPSGVVVLTFDDGPDRDVTPGLVRTLSDLGVPATFFMVGNRVASAPRLAKRVEDAGFTIANHSYHHDLMTRQSNDAVRRTLRNTHRQFRKAGLTPSALMRPPYGGIDRRVERTIRGMGLVPVLWDVDPRDWETRRSTANIAHGVLSRLRPGQSNVVLLHDGVRNSPHSARAVPRIVKQARKRGYCFGDLDDRGRAVLPTPRVSASAAPVAEGRKVRLTLRLNAASARRTAVQVDTVDGTAVAGVDYKATSERVVIPAGKTRATVTVRTRGDGMDGRTKRFTFRLSDAKRMEIATEEVTARIRNADRPPRARVLDSRVRAAPSNGGPARQVRGLLTVRLSEVSARPVRVTVREVRRSGVRARRTVTVPAGERKVSVAVRLRRTGDGPKHRVRVRIVEAKNARINPKPARLVVVRPE